MQEHDTKTTEIECGALVVTAMIISVSLVAQMWLHYLEQASFTVLHVYITLGITMLFWIGWSLAKNVPWSDRVIVGHSLHLGGMVSLGMATIGGLIELSPGLSFSGVGDHLGSMTLLAMFITGGAAVALGCGIRLGRGL